LQFTESTGEAFSPQKRTSSTSKHEILNFFLFLLVIFPRFQQRSGSETLFTVQVEFLPGGPSCCHAKFLFKITSVFLLRYPEADTLFISLLLPWIYKVKKQVER
jgi:hypothetical protein